MDIIFLHGFDLFVQFIIIFDFCGFVGGNILWDYSLDSHVDYVM